MGWRRRENRGEEGGAYFEISPPMPPLRVVDPRGGRLVPNAKQWEAAKRGCLQHLEQACVVQGRRACALQSARRCRPSLLQRIMRGEANAETVSKCEEDRWTECVAALACENQAARVCTLAFDA